MACTGVLGLISPAFIALAIAAGMLQFSYDSRAVLWLGLGCLAMGLFFARHTRQLFAAAINRVRTLQ